MGMFHGDGLRGFSMGMFHRDIPDALCTTAAAKVGWWCLYQLQIFQIGRSLNIPRCSNQA